MKIALPREKRKARIEIIPLIDIVFFLLATFVMVSMSMIKNQGITVKLPQASSSSAQERKDFITLTVTENDQFYLDKEKMDREDVISRIRKMKNQNSDLRIFINGDEKANFGDAVGILDEIRLLGIEKVSIQTRSKGKK